MQTRSLSPRSVARITGLLYLVIIVCGLFSEVFVRGALVVPGDASATAEALATHAFRFRLGFVSDLLMALSDVAVGVAFFVLLRPVSLGLSALAAALRLAQAAVIGLNLLNHFWPLLLLQPGGPGAAFDAPQLQALVALFLQAHATGYVISGVFFGMSLLVLGHLLYRGGLVPRWLAVGVLVGGVAYLADCTTQFLFPAHAHQSGMVVMVTAIISELALCLWLLVKGVRG